MYIAHILYIVDFVDILAMLTRFFIVVIDDIVHIVCIVEIVDIVYTLLMHCWLIVDIVVIIDIAGSVAFIYIVYIVDIT